MSPDDIEKKLAGSRSEGWYHIIELAPGVFTPGLKSLIPQWEMMRSVRLGIDYAGKHVLDIASYDGMWAFDAESLGAKSVVATDCIFIDTYRNFLFAHHCLQSGVLPYFNVPAHKVYDRMDVVIDSMREKFDIVHHLGLLYHLRDPMATLAQARCCLKDRGVLFIETAVYTDNQATMLFNGRSERAYCDHTTTWIPTIPCLIEMLDYCGFDVDETSLGMLVQKDGRCTARACLIAYARVLDKSDGIDRESMLARNMGIR